MKKISMIISVLLVTLFIIILPGCGNKNTETEITLMIPEWRVPTDEMLDEFTDETGIKVNVETVAWDDIRDKIAVAANGAKAAADVVEVDWSWVGEFYSAGWLEPLNLEKEDIEDIPSLSSFTADGKILGVPYANDFRIGYYNTEIYAQAGLTEPNTFTEVATQMQAIKNEGILQYPYTLPLNAGEGTTTALIWLTYLRDDKVFNNDNTLNKENVLESLQFIDQMVKAGLINPANITSKDIDTYRQLTSGDAAFMVGPTSFVGRVNNEGESKVIGKVKAIVPPGDTVKAKQTMSLTEGIGVLKYSKNKEAAETFVQWYTSRKMQARLYTELSVLPTRNSVLLEKINSGELKNAGALQETAVLIQSPFPNGVPDFYTEMSTAISNAVNKMASGALTPEQAFDEMNAKITALAKK